MFKIYIKFYQNLNLISLFTINSNNPSSIPSLNIENKIAKFRSKIQDLQPYLNRN